MKKIFMCAFLALNAASAQAMQDQEKKMIVAIPFDPEQKPFLRELPIADQRELERYWGAHASNFKWVQNEKGAWNLSWNLKHAKITIKAIKEQEIKQDHV